MISKWSKYDESIDEELYSGRTDYSQIARDILSNSVGFDFGQGDVDLLRTYIRRRRESLFSDDDLEEEKILVEETITNQYNNQEPFVISAWDSVSGRMMDIVEYCEVYKLPYDDISSYKLVTHTGTPYYNIAFKSNILTSEVSITEAINNAVNDAIKTYDFGDIAYKPQGEINKGDFTRLVISDVHIGMETNSEGIAMYATPWDEESILNTFSRVVQDTINHRKGEDLYIDDLGDFLDGYDGLTTRGGHQIPQNMSNIEGFQLGLKIKISLVKALKPYFRRVYCTNVCNTNHDGDWGAALNIAFKSSIEAMINNVFVKNITSFIGHYFVGDHCFILCHGKDKKHLKFGFKPVLDAKQIEHIENYINFHSLYNKSKYIEFSKGDSHQLIRDWSTAQGFNYMNYLALSPSSEWVQTNFKKGSRGFTIQTGNYLEGDLNEKHIIIRDNE